MLSLFNFAGKFILSLTIPLVIADESQQLKEEMFNLKMSRALKHLLYPEKQKITHISYPFKHGGNQKSNRDHAKFILLKYSPLSFSASRSSHYLKTQTWLETSTIRMILNSRALRKVIFRLGALIFIDQIFEYLPCMRHSPRYQGYSNKLAPEKVSPSLIMTTSLTLNFL